MENYLKELITLRTDGVVHAMKSRKEIETLFDKVTYNYRPLLNGERYLSDLEVSHRLKISRRTLQEYRDSGIVPYIIEDFLPKTLFIQKKVVPLWQQFPPRLLTMRTTVGLRFLYKVKILNDGNIYK